MPENHQSKTTRPAPFNELLMSGKRLNNKRKIMKLINAHKKISRLVTKEDLQRIYEEAEEMYKLLLKPIGMYNVFYAIAHPQVTSDDPLRFFVVNTSNEIFKKYFSAVVINPVIVNHTKQLIDSEEGCMTFTNLPMKKVNRYNKITVELNFLEFDKRHDPVENKDYHVPALGPRQTIEFSGKKSKIFQHEIDHLNAEYIY